LFLYFKFFFGGGGEVREKVEGQQYTSPWGQQFKSWVENTNHE
jgi:hypothetical protein